MTEPELRTVRSFCRICTAVCGILVDVSGDEVVRVRGDQDHPFSHGYTCPEGACVAADAPPPRASRTSTDADRRPAPTDDLGDLPRRPRDAARVPSSTRTEPEAIGVFFGSGVGMDAAGYRTAEALYKALGTPARFSPLTIDGTAKVIVSDQVGGFPGLSPHVDADHATLVVYVGCNPVVSHGHTSAMPDPVTAIRALRARADVWVVDPRRTETARLATDHLAPRPGTDFAVLAMLVREILRDGADRDVLERRTVGSGRARRRGRALHHRAHVPDRRRLRGRPDTTAGRGAPRRARCRRHRHRRHHVGQCQRDAVARLGPDDRDGFDEPPRGRLVPPRVRPPTRRVPAPRSHRPTACSAPARRAVPKHAPSWASGRVPCSATRSAPATSARC